MRTRWPLLVAIGIVALFVAGVAGGLGLAAANGTADTYGPGLLGAFGAFTVVGALVVARQPSNTIGWLFSAVGIFASTGVFATEYAGYAYITHPGSLPGGVWMAWYATWFWFPAITAAIIFPPMLFPNGRVLSRRWRPLLGLAIVGLLTFVGPTMFAETLELEGAKVITVDNPIGIAGVVDGESGFLGAISGLTFALAVLGGIASMVLRFRRSRGVERQQLKWFTYAAALLFLAPLGDVFPVLLGPFEDTLFPLVVAFVPIAAGIAILRYRLYDIDNVVNRTLVYGSLTAFLATCYFGSVVALQAVLPTEGKDLAVAASTLAVAGLFRPASRRIQRFIYGRFYRSRYDSHRTLEQFGGRLRDEVDLDSLRTDLVTVVSSTLHPAHAGLWLADPGGST